MGILTARELTDMRAAGTAQLPDTCTISYVTSTKDGMGAWTDSWSNRGTAIPCRIISNASLTNTDGITREGGRYTLSVAWNQAMALTDRVVTGGGTYYVRAINDMDSERVLKRAELERLN